MSITLKQAVAMQAVANPAEKIPAVEVYDLACSQKSLEIFDDAVVYSHIPCQLDHISILTSTAFSGAFSIVGKILLIGLELIPTARSVYNLQGKNALYHFLNVIVLNPLQVLTTILSTIIRVAFSILGIIIPDVSLHAFRIAAFVAQNGESLFDLALSGGPSEIPDVVITDEKNLIQSLDLKKVKHTLYRDCPSALADWAIQKLKPQPMRPFLTPINWVDSGKTEHKRTYILCEDDRDVHPITQLNVLKHYPCRIIKLKSGHFPFLSHINELGQILSMIKE